MPCSWAEKVKYYEDINYPIFLYKFNAFPTKVDYYTMAQAMFAIYIKQFNEYSKIIKIIIEHINWERLRDFKT